MGRAVDDVLGFAWKVAGVNRRRVPLLEYSPRVLRMRTGSCRYLLLLDDTYNLLAKFEHPQLSRRLNNNPCLLQSQHPLTVVFRPCRPSAHDWRRHVYS